MAIEPVEGAGDGAFAGLGPAVAAQLRAAMPAAAATEAEAGPRPGTAAGQRAKPAQPAKTRVVRGSGRIVALMLELVLVDLKFL